MGWDEYWINIASTVLTKSQDQSTKVGAVIVSGKHIVATGFNGFPKGIDDFNPEYHKRPLKYQVTEHAERNAIFQAAAERGGTAGATMYLAHNPVDAICSGCARAIIQAEIACVIGPLNPTFMGKGEQWKHDCRVGSDLLSEARIHVGVIVC